MSASRDFRIPRARVAGANDDAYFSIIAESIWPSTDDEDTPEHLGLGTPGQRAIYITMLFARLTDNGGLQGVLWNMQAWFIDAALEGFERIGATEYAAALRKGVRVLFGDQPPRDLDVRRSAIDAKGRDWLHEHVDPLYEHLYGEARLHPYWRRYIDAHEREFFLD